MHEDELEISDELVRRLIARDVPELRDRLVQRLPASGSTNVLFRVGPDHLVRLPRQHGGGNLIEAEARWLPHLGPSLPVSVPEVVALGDPGFGYPERWAVTGWIEGTLPSTPEPAGPSADALAGELATFLKALRDAEVPAQASADPALRSYRAGPLSAIDADICQYIDDCRALPELPLDLDACVEVWAEAVALPSSEGAPARWVHGDLLAENLLLRERHLAAVLDFGALAVGDPSVDLVIAWEVFGPGAREVLRSNLDLDDITCYWRSMPARCTSRLAMAQHVLADHQRGADR